MDGLRETYPFACIVTEGRGSFISIAQLEARGAPEQLIMLVVHGPIEAAARLLWKFDQRLTIHENS